MAAEKYENIEAEMPEITWDQYKRELIQALLYLPHDIRMARIELADNHWHGRVSSDELWKRAHNNSAPQHGEIFEGTIGAENF